MGDHATLGTAGAGPVAEDSGYGGFSVMGMNHRLLECAASGSREDGLRLWGMHFDVRGCIATGNHKDGINGMGEDWWVTGNHANGNDHDGIVIGGIRVADLGGNGGSGNRGLGKQGRATQWPDQRPRLPALGPKGGPMRRLRATSLALLGLLAASAGLAQNALALTACTAAQISSQDPGCPSGTGPCTVTRDFTVTDGCILDFGTRAVTIGATGKLRTAPGAVTIRAGSLTVAPRGFIDARGLAPRSIGAVW